MVLKKTPKSPLTARRSNQSFLKEINNEYSLERLMLKRQYFGHPIQTANSLEKSLMLGKIESRRRGCQGWDGWIASLMQWTWTWANFGKWWGTEKLGVLQSTGLQRVRHDWVTDNSLDYPPSAWHPWHLPGDPGPGLSLLRAPTGCHHPCVVLKAHSNLCSACRLLCPLHSSTSQSQGSFHLERVDRRL